jgi:hypothetical protein
LLLPCFQCPDCRAVNVFVRDRKANRGFR